MGGDISLLANNRTSQNGTFKKVKNEGWQTSFFIQLEHPFTNKQWNGSNAHFGFGFRWMYGKTYKIGMGLGLGWNDFICRNKDGQLNLLKGETSMRNFQLRGELFQRLTIRMWGINWDLGVYGGINATRNIMLVENLTWTDDNDNALNPQPYDNKVVTYISNAKAMNRFEYGATTRISYIIANLINFGIYGSYRLSPILTKDDAILGTTANNPSPWSVGVEIEFAP